MQNQELKELLSAQFPDSEIRVAGDGSHFDALIVSEKFTGLSTLKRQQLVYVAVGKAITDGTLHAINIKAYTPTEWEQADA